MSRSSATILLALGATFGSASAFAQAPAAPHALTRSAEDPQLEWGACPAFMPAGCGLVVLHGDPSHANADVFLRLPPRAELPEHWHTSAERMILVAGELTVQYQGQAKVVLRPGMYAYGPAKLPHRAACGAGTSCILFIAFESAVDAVPVAERRSQDPAAPRPR
jgi:quercetin dioxygenase-like cupin family protein